MIAQQCKECNEVIVDHHFIFHMGEIMKLLLMLIVMSMFISGCLSPRIYEKPQQENIIQDDMPNDNWLNQEWWRGEDDARTWLNWNT